MCAIAGYVGNLDRDKLLLMLQAMSHRGPDDKGVFIKGPVGLGHNRLSIIDLSSSGHQPMFDDEKKMCIVFNGEIYNFRELRKELSRSFRFRSLTDTEVILYAYKKWGVNSLKRLNGMFAFVIYDLEKNLLFGARDRVGEKPLKYFMGDSTFAFASEVKGLLPILDHRPEIDYEAVNDYLTLQYVPTPKTGFKNIYKLPAGHYFIYGEGGLSIQRYWQLDFRNKLDMNDNEWIDRLEAEVNTAVKQRMISDVPIGVLLSGGVDSSAVVAFMSKNSKQRVKTFSIGFSDKDFDESRYSHEISKMYHTDHTHLMVDSKVFKTILPEISDHYDEPFADNSAIPSLIVSKLARKEMKVALTGDGGDENFAGYERYNIVRISQLYDNVPRFLRKELFSRLGSAIFAIKPNLFTKRIKTFLQTQDMPFYERYLFYRCFFNGKEKSDLYSRDFNKSMKNNDTFIIYKDSFNKNLSQLDNALSFDIASYLPDDLLFKMDTASMAFGLEVRAPLLDYKLMEFSAKIPDNLKANLYSKKILFKNMLYRKNILPKDILNRPKQGFVAPIEKWMKTDLKDYVKEQLNSKKFRNTEVFDNKKLDSYINSYFSSPVDYSNNIFALLGFSSWVNKYF